ncbi:MAG: alpha/beta hydrolase [Actinobacteria bacterium]|nr:alpha/beta hydrolase [Actinomycetota bacterium]
MSTTTVTERSVCSAFSSVKGPVVSPGRRRFRYEWGRKVEQGDAMGPTWVQELDGEAGEWAARGRWLDHDGHAVFVVDVPSSGPEELAPLVSLHGFPSSSIDLARVIDDLAVNRRVIACDYLGFGLSDKPDQRYTMAGCADVVATVLQRLEVSRFSLLSHDMGDTVCGELLARNLAGTWDVEIVDRFLTNGSIYLELAQLTAGQQFLLAMPDERGDVSIAPDAAALSASLAATLSPNVGAAGVELMRPAAEHLVGGAGATLLPRLIRYLEERRDNEAHFTGALERHPSPVTVIWGVDDPIAVVSMVERFAAARPDARVVLLDGVGHYPMMEAPTAFVDALLGEALRP